MAGLKNLAAAGARASRTVWGLIAALFATLFGSIDWYAPDWLRFIGRRLRSGFQSLHAGIRAHPARSAGIGVLLLGLIGGGIGAWRWYESRPKPQLVTFEVGAPTRTCYECDPPGAPNPLRVRFSASVAPIESSGKPLDPAQQLVTLSPSHPGSWQWLDDRTLSFDPGEDWPIGQAFDVAFDEKRFVASHQRLQHYEFEFTSPAFEAKVRNTEFHQDPSVATDKKAVLTLGFSHPVDTADLEKRVSLHLYDKVADGKEEDLGEVAYRVTYDDKKLEAYIASEQLKVPAKEGRLEFKIDEGLRAARGGNTSPAAMKSEVKVPGINSLAVNELKLDLARDLADDPQQVAVLEFNFPVPENQTPSRFKAWLLPARHPDPEQQGQFEKQAGRGVPYDWSSGTDNRVLEKSQPLKLEAVAGERDNSELQSFRYSADPGRFVYLRVDKGLTAFGGYRLGETQERVLRVPEYPRELRVVASGSLLAMSGPKLLNILSRDVPAMKVEVSRLLPRQLQHLVSQTQGEFSRPEFKGYGLDGDHLTERFTRTEPLPKTGAGKPGYTTLDLGAYLKDGDDDRRGIFLLKLQGWDAEHNRPVTTAQINEWGDPFDGPVTDSRLVVVTDLGILVKRNLDGGSDVFVQSIHTGAPMQGASVEIIGRNGLAVLERSTDADGHVRFPSLKDFKREQQPVMVLARKDGDTSFLPLDHRLRELDLSRFDVGGVGNSADRTALSAYLFSDRGVYRPGEEIRLGAIVRTQDWSPLPKGLPLLLEVTDPRGQLVRKERMPLSAAGFEDIRHATKPASPTGTWTFSLSIVKDQYRNELVGSVTVLVREFEADRLKMGVTLSDQRTLGWVSPDQLKARIDLQNLFGAPAQQRRVTATLRLTPRMPEFAPYRDYAFHDPQAAKEGFSEELPETTTDDKGAAAFDLHLDRFARATYRVQVVAQGFEAEGGRGVAGEVTQLVSNMPFLVGVKPDGDMSYVSRNAQRSAHLIAVDPTLAKVAAKDLTLRRLEIKYVSTLVKQRNGTFKYESRRREATLKDEPLEIAAAGNALTLDSSTPGSFAYAVLDKSGQQLARLDYTVAGDANLSARMEKNAELQLALSKKDYAPGEEIELQI
ncbi:MAG: MG2 domain-containing protein, partial [Panacagrimonas sp.]